MPSFLSTKRSKAITVAAAGTLTVAAAISAVTLPSSSSSVPGNADAALAVAVSAQAAAQASQPAVSNGSQQVLRFDKARTFAGQRQAQQLAAARAAAAKAAAARAAREAAAQRTAATQPPAQPTTVQPTAQSTQQAQSTAQSQPVQQAVAVAPSGTAQQIAEQMLSSYGWSQSQFSCLEPLWGHESGWSVTAQNPSSGAYGIPQALPGSQMSSAGSDWQTNAATQIRWGLNYIKDRYGSPCGAWDHEQADGWY